MNASTWIALGALVAAAAGPVTGMLLANAKRDGKVDAVLEQLTAIAGDHEDRLRAGSL